MLDPVQLTNVNECPLQFKGFAADSSCEPIAWGVLVPTIFHVVLKKNAPTDSSSRGKGLMTLYLNIPWLLLQGMRSTLKCKLRAKLR